MSWSEILLFSLIAMIVGVQIQTFLRLRKYAQRLEREITQQTKELLLYQVLNILRPLPLMRGWAISPDLGWIYVSQIFERHPSVILECGSGVSTILAAYTLKQLGGGKVIALDHENKFAEATKKYIQAHDLDEYAEVIFTPLIKKKIEDREFLWYDLTNLRLPLKIDFLFIDGPPGHLQPFSRYGALPLLKSRMHNDTVLLLDDANRKEERLIISDWMKQYPLQLQSFKAEKGAALLTFKPLLQPKS